jgi:hypothetical protein
MTMEDMLVWPTTHGEWTLERRRDPSAPEVVAMLSDADGGALDLGRDDARRIRDWLDELLAASS